MSQKFEQLLDYLVNEEMDKANELFHEIVVEKSREIYEDLINEEIETEAKEEEAEESVEEAHDEESDDHQDESVEEAEESVEENEELEDSYVMDASDEEDDHGFAKGDAADELGAEVMAGDDDMDDMDDMGDDEGDEDKAIYDIKNAIEELEAAFAELEKAQGHEGGDDFGDDDMGGDMDADMGDEEPMMGVKEGKRLTREYVEKVGNDWEKNSQKAQGKAAGADTGESMGSPAEGKSPVSSGKGKPTTGADAKNIVHGGKGENQDGTKPHGKASGLVSAAKDMKTGNGNVPGGKMGVKNLSKVAHGHGAEKKGAGPGPVGAGTGDKAGQTSVGNEKSLLGSKKL